MKAGRAVTFVAAVAAVAGAAYWIAREAVSPPPEDDGEAVVDDEPAAQLARGERFERVGSVSRDVFESFPGKVVTEGRIEVRAPQGMRVAVVEIVKDEGDFVKKGDVLLRFNREEIERAIEKAERDGDGEALKRFRGYLEHAELRSPVDGQVRDVWTELGRVPVDEGIPMMTLADRGSYTFHVQVPQSLTKTVTHMGARVTADLEGNLGKATGTVTGFEDAPEGWIGVVVGLDPKEGLENDLKATLRAPTSKQEVALVPKAAVVQRGDVKIVRVWEPSDRTVAERTIVTDGEQGDAWVVVAGVFPGESVVVASSGR
jgi:multidrug efflux pump subunit AcrA (membrane-fusion protein)